MFITNISVIPLLSVIILLSIYSIDIDIIFSSSTLSYLTSVYYSVTIDYITISCLSMLLACFSIAGIFYWHYFSWHSDYLIVNIQGFVLSMVYLILSSNVVSSFIGWELLGISSFFLILYYSIYYSSRAASVTVLSSRLGDVGFFLFIFCVIEDCFTSINVTCCLFISLLLISKSAVFPLTSWLLEAMRAPTPVSSLVHSSTLVAAGIVLICRYEVYLVNGSYSYIFLILCLCTVSLSAAAAFFYSDTKKIIALSTCNNISWCYIYLYNGMVELCLVQLFCHGVFKCMLFCLIGDFLVNSNNSQNKSMHYYCSSSSYSILINLICLFISGAPFLGVYFSKHLFISYSSELESISILILVLVALSMSFLYTFRLLNVINIELNSSSNGFNNLFYTGVNLLPVLLLINSVISNNLLEDYLPSTIVTVLVNTLIILMSGLGYSLCYSNTSRWSSSLYGQDFFIYDLTYITSIINDVGYTSWIFRWEASLVTILGEARSERTSGLSVLLIISLMFYLFIIV
uniref:NADH:ubiquinone reductase (H(+)-translocating) n=1 Tax=Gyrodactylus derjavinoides TaxID=368976 RepID=B3FNP7_9PLAT|nr:NADH dehydrogenase subunit 5 [Gyrodactylus derjavinoides]ABX59346.1 NADH dehydrogenase subunit 5 [Gyrodactylus derjavinoides]